MSEMTEAREELLRAWYDDPYVCHTALAKERGLEALAAVTHFRDVARAVLARAERAEHAVAELKGELIESLRLRLEALEARNRAEEMEGRLRATLAAVSKPLHIRGRFADEERYECPVCRLRISVCAARLATSCAGRRARAVLEESSSLPGERSSSCLLRAQTAVETLIRAYSHPADRDPALIEQALRLGYAVLRERDQEAG